MKNAKVRVDRESKRTISAIILTMLILAVVNGASGVAASPTKKLEVETDKDVYCLREDVKISITNIGDETVQLQSDPPLRILDETGSPVFPEFVLFIIIWIKPGETLTYTWNQMNDFTDTLVPPGKYTVETNSELEPAPSKMFEIAVCPPVGGVWVPINKTELLTPWIGLASLITVAAVSVIYVKRRNEH